MRFFVNHPVVRWLLIVLVLLILLSVTALWSWGRFARSAQGEPSTALPVAAADAPLDRLIQPFLDARPANVSGAAFLGDPIAAFNARASTARAAGRTLDVQYYIWEHDTTGRLLERELMKAAERGVRVRMLIDDVNTAGRDDELLAMAAHPNVEIRLFKPARNRKSGLRRAVEMALRFIGFDRRMHNKAWIADNRVAIVGGRNIGDRYFGASREVNYRDSDLLVLGPAVGEASAIFDEFWNSREVVPLQALQNNGSHWSQEEFAAKRQQWLATAKATSWGRALAKREDLQERLQQGDLPLHWSSSIHVLSDPPEKAAPLSSRRERAGWLLYDIMALLYSARQESWLMTPYFVPGKGGTVLLAGQVRRGMKVRVLTNSLATNVVPLVYASYSKYRKLLLGQGVSLYELNPDPGDFGSDHGVSLHSKAFVVDNERGFVGSFNFDPRSEQLNTEMGVVFDDMELAQELTQFFEKSIQLENAWHVTLTSGGDLRWHGEDGRAWEHEPETSAGLRWLVWLMAFLPIESEL